MGKIIFVEHNSTEHVAKLDVGSTLMQIAVTNAVPGIDGDCGAECACGTCHIVVDGQWFNRTGEIADVEEQMLSMTPERTDTSRLGCQVKVTEEMDGMIVYLPEFQM
ncbi:2Fe-2S iron-sulfur cluster-binding protein [Limnobacter sp. UBA1615]|uniref:2Fe-2S iron-sulfur cluster-binding protein n=1 Tax=Limnobacter sp. UBA1615 TaxID=1946757 RepID=UPI0025C20E11|nr:2Fe-2S iron-sulfur cluster-binding protein [Limnobacter sp. UBA1615]